MLQMFTPSVHWLGQEASAMPRSCENTLYHSLFEEGVTCSTGYAPHHMIHTLVKFLSIFMYDLTPIV